MYRVTLTIFAFNVFFLNHFLQFVLPDSNMKGKTQEANDAPSKYWCVDNMYAFENVGFSKTVDGVKYLICADCEVGPIGWHDLNTKLSYVSLCKTSYC